MPEPPYSSSTVMPCKPSAPICGHRSRGKVLVLSIWSARGAILSSEKLRVVSRSMSMSEPSPKSKPCQALGIMRALLHYEHDLFRKPVPAVRDHALHGRHYSAKREPQATAARSGPASAMS